ncbi:hypothetical protein ACOR62_08835 [Neisseria lisongii]|uniref:Uncharacterized protein n=1 Tax=Neisseria lisongii TaxID=2912188 RepID=A0AAW5AK86_9NEIS|nr:hypothetical protein [Neisseria lisongii]MCF7530317.1 hypothetical protein [Neisseria lisongii]
MNTAKLHQRAPKPLCVVPQHQHTSHESAYAALRALVTAYPNVRFGMFYTSGVWLVFRVHEQDQQALREQQLLQAVGGCRV